MHLQPCAEVINWDALVEMKEDGMKGHLGSRRRVALAAAALLIFILPAVIARMPVMAQTLGEPQAFTAVAILNNNLGSGAGTVDIRISRWSTEAERMMLVSTLLQKGPDALLRELQKQRSVGTIKTPDSLAYDLRYSQQTPGEDGGRRIVLGTDRPIGFWEASHQPRTIQYPFTVIQMQIGRDGKGSGTLSYATKVIAHDNTIELENYATSPIMLTRIEQHDVHR
jgi:hypothetical protein